MEHPLREDGCITVVSHRPSTSRGRAKVNVPRSSSPMKIFAEGIPTYAKLRPKSRNPQSTMMTALGHMRASSNGTVNAASGTRQTPIQGPPVVGPASHVKWLRSEPGRFTH